MYAAPRGSIEPIFRGQGQEACLTDQVASATSLFMITNRDRLFSARSTEALSLLPPSSELEGDRTVPQSGADFACRRSAHRTRRSLDHGIFKAFPATQGLGTSRQAQHRARRIWLVRVRSSHELSAQWVNMMCCPGRKDASWSAFICPRTATPDACSWRCCSWDAMSNTRRTGSANFVVCVKHHVACQGNIKPVVVFRCTIARDACPDALLATS